VAINTTVRSSADALWFVGLVQTTYALVFAAVGASLALLAALLRRTLIRGHRAEASVLCSFACTTTAALGCFGAFVAVQQAVIEPPTRLEVFPGVTALGLAAAVVTASLLFAWRRRLWMTGPITVIAGLAAILAAPLSAWRASERELGDPQATPSFSLVQDRRVLLLGLDGLEWHKLDSLMAAGRLPNFRSLCGRAVTSPLQTTSPTWSPILWTTMVTGVAEEVHGIRDFTEILLPGLRGGVQRLRKDPLLPEGWGLALLFEQGVQSGWLSEVPVRGYGRRTKALWNILSDQGAEVAVVNWFATWPAEKVRGFLISDNHPSRHAFLARKHGAAHPTTGGVSYPAALLTDLAAKLAVDLEAAPWSLDQLLALSFFADVPADQVAKLKKWIQGPEIFQIIHEGDRFASAAAQALWHREVQFLALYLSGVDNISHRFWQFDGVVDRYYEYVDGVLGELLPLLTENDTLVLVSDHGWSYQEGGRFGHDDAPDGVLVLAGAGVRESAEFSRKPTIFDVTPTILSLFGLPRARNMAGMILREALAPVAEESLSPAEVSTYGEHSPQWASVDESARQSGQGTEETMEKLRALGYVR
jgi:hypothetical protein